MSRVKKKHGIIVVKQYIADTNYSNLWR